MVLKLTVFIAFLGLFINGVSFAQEPISYALDKRITSGDDFRIYSNLKDDAKQLTETLRLMHLRKMARFIGERNGVSISLGKLSQKNLSSEFSSYIAYGQLAKVEDALEELSFHKVGQFQKLGIGIVVFDNVAKFSSTVTEGRVVHIDNFDRYYWKPTTDAVMSGETHLDSMGRIWASSSGLGPFVGVGVLMSGAVDVLSTPFRAANYIGREIAGDESLDTHVTSLNGIRQITANEIQDAIERIIPKAIAEDANKK